MQMFFEIRIANIIVTCVTVNTSTTLWRDGTYFDSQRELLASVIKVLHSMIISTGAIVIAATTTYVTIIKIEPQPSGQITLSTLGVLKLNWFGI
jgi:hypothetical protein